MGKQKHTKNDNELEDELKELLSIQRKTIIEMMKTKMMKNTQEMNTCVSEFLKRFMSK